MQLSALVHRFWQLAGVVCLLEVKGKSVRLADQDPSLTALRAGFLHREAEAAVLQHEGHIHLEAAHGALLGDNVLGSPGRRADHLEGNQWQIHCRRDLYFRELLLQGVVQRPAA